MKNEQKFKQRIAEVAAKIAGIEEKVDANKLNLPTSYKTQANSAIATPADLAQAMLDYMEELVANEPSMQDIKDRAGWNMLVDRLKQLGGMKGKSDSSEDVPDVSADDKNSMDLPPLKEAFNRINRR